MLNAQTALRTSRLLLIPYLPHHVPKYHEWMTDPDTLARTCSEPLSLKEECENQVSWLNAEDKCTFIICPLNEEGKPKLAIGDCNSFVLHEDSIPPPSANTTNAGVTRRFVLEVEVSISEGGYRRRGYAQESILMLMWYLLKNYHEDMEHKDVETDEGHKEPANFTFVAKILRSNTESIALFKKKLQFTPFKEIEVFNEVHLRRDFNEGNIEQSLRDINEALMQLNHNKGVGIQQIAYTSSLEDSMEWRPWTELASVAAARTSISPVSAKAGETLFRSFVDPTEQEDCGCPGLGYLLFDVLVPGEEEVPCTLQFCHACDANCILQRGRIVAAADIAQGTPLSLNLSLCYRCVSWPFPCKPFCEAMERAIASGASSDEKKKGQQHNACFFPRKGDPEQMHHQGNVLGLAEVHQTSSDLFNHWLSLADVQAKHGLNFTPKITSCPPDSVVINQTRDIGLAPFAVRTLNEGEVVFHCVGLPIQFPTMYTLCTGPGRHLLFAPDGQSLAHSCNPNLFIRCFDGNSDERTEKSNEVGFDAVALRSIQPGEVLSFNYLTTEWAMDCPFKCGCGEKQCFGMINGFKNLTEEQRRRLMPYITPVVREQYLNEK